MRRSKLAKELGLDEHEDYVDAWFVYQIEEGLNLLGESITEREMKALRVKTPPLQTAESKNDLSGAFSAAAVSMEAVAQILGQDGAKRWVEKVHRALSAAFEADLKFGRDHEDLSQVVPLDFSPKGTAQLWLDMHDGYNDYYFAQRGVRPALVGPVNTWFRREGARLQKIASGADPSATSTTASAGCLSSAVLGLLILAVIMVLLDL